MKNPAEKADPVILIADHHVISRKGVKFIIYTNFGKYKIIEADTADEVIRLVEEHKFTHLILEMELDFGLNMKNFIELRKNYPDIQILIYTKNTGRFSGQRMLQFGANSFLVKINPEEEIVKALDLFLQGKPYISPHLREIIIDDNFGELEDPIGKLSERELTVLDYLLQGEGVKKIASKMNIKPNTVATFKLRIFNKFGVTNVIDLYVLAQLYNYKPTVIAEPLLVKKEA